jgi:hypothetical protein
MLGFFPGEPTTSLRPALARRQRYIRWNISTSCLEKGWTQAEQPLQDSEMPQVMAAA